MDDYLPGKRMPVVSTLCFLLCLSSIFVLCSGCATIKLDPSVKAQIKAKAPHRCVVLKAPEIAYVTYKNGKLNLGGPYDEKKWRAEISDGRDKESSLGTAIPLTKDGYYVTAYHCIKRLRGSEKVWLIAYNPDDPTKPKWSSAQIVWKSSDDDLALLRSDLKLPYCFTFSAAGKVLSKGSVVAQCGIRSGCEFGRTKEDVLLDQPNKSSVVIRHTARVVNGDSGGPFLNLEGELLGITTCRGIPVLDRLGFSWSVAVRPNVYMIERLLKEDRIKRETDHAP